MSDDRQTDPGLYELPFHTPAGRTPVYVANDQREIVAIYFQPADEPDRVCRRKLAAIQRGEPTASPVRDLELVKGHGSEGGSS